MKAEKQEKAAKAAKAAKETKNAEEVKEAKEAKPVKAAKQVKAAKPAKNAKPGKAVKAESAEKAEQANHQEAATAPVPSPAVKHEHKSKAAALPEGTFAVRLPKTLRKQLEARMQEEEVTMDELITYLLTRGLPMIAMTDGQ